MPKEIFEESKGIAKIVQVVLITFFCLLFSVVIVLSIPGNRENSAWILSAQSIQTIVLFIFPAVIVAFLWNKAPKEYYHLSKKISWKTFLVLVMTVLLMVPFINLLSELNHAVHFPEALNEYETQIRNSELESHLRTEKLLSTDNLLFFVIRLITVAMIPACCEELFFRGCLQNVIREWKGKHVAAWSVGIIFSLIHFQIFNFLPRLLWGVLFAYLLIWSGSLWLPTVAHFVNNGIIVLYYFLKAKEMNIPDINTVGTGDTLYVGIISLLVTVGGLCFIRKVLIKTS
ncbi:MAG: CPBP family intramembrane metalloprotease [Prevotellaceae bacterium]|jgi:membrane protease YdiL (CAAX protease family)|nr:CPBP family intramembrane metalloprotease [Prevotellaceae bacterium]